MQATQLRRSCAAVAAAAVLATAGTLSHAARPGANDAIAIDDANVSMSQAVTAAERHSGGKAVRAEYEDTDAGRAWDVEVVNGARVLDVRIDAVSGNVLSSHEDQADHDDDHDRRD